MEMKRIHVNQLGYRPSDPKRAVIPQDDTAFRVIRVSDETVVYDGTAGEVIHDAVSIDDVRIADFSMLRETGEYVLCAAGERSYPFVIGNNPYADLRAALLDMFHYQKCGVDLDCGPWSHPACHNSLATIYGTDEKKDVSGGWHDAGDYGRYIVPTSMTVADLLLAHELSPNPDPKLLETVWFEVEWMLKMQDAKTGGVYHKVGCRQFNALDEMPHDEHDELILSPISSTATADFAATMALASRFYPDNKRILLDAAKRAWDWCVANPDAPNFTNPPDIKTGQYGDVDDKDERFWAACELFVATGDETYHDAIKSGNVYSGLGWADMGTYGLVAYLHHAGDKACASLTTIMKEKLLSACRDIMNQYENEPYGISLGAKYRWGSNLDVGNNAMMLLLGSRFTEDGAAYIEAALEHLHYLLGRNPLSQSYVTGFGPTAPKHPHHRPSVAVGSAVPGMVVGGPNMNTLRDTDLHSRCEGLPPSKCYVDHEGSFSSNEVTIYWNSTVYFLVAFLGL
ncbi:MAG: glycoside hydrolase family 9 protein [Treponema sp.]|nr:glycoside hydrolase family 9 protein [Treponema sp.]